MKNAKETAAVAMIGNVERQEREGFGATPSERVACCLVLTRFRIGWKLQVKTLGALASTTTLLSFAYVLIANLLLHHVWSW